MVPATLPGPGRAVLRPVLAAVGLDPAAHRKKGPSVREPALEPVHPESHAGREHENQPGQHDDGDERAISWRRRRVAGRPRLGARSSTGAEALAHGMTRWTGLPRMLTFQVVFTRPGIMFPDRLAW